jgi:hypothetical protein
MRSPDEVARWHESASLGALYGPGYVNPDKRYKLASLQLRDAEFCSVGSSRVMQIRSDFFRGGERAFYGAGGIASQVSHLTPVLGRIAGSRVKHVIVGLDPWWFNPSNPVTTVDPAVEAEYSDAWDRLGALQGAIKHSWQDLAGHKLSLVRIVSDRADMGTSAIMRGDGFRRDGSYSYAFELAHPTETEDFEFRDTLGRIRTRSRLFEVGDHPSVAALATLRTFLRTSKALGIDVALFAPPFPPTIGGALRASGVHQYVWELPERIEQVAKEEGVGFVNFTDCGPIACDDEEFIDGLHGGSRIYARIVLELARRLPWLDAAVDAGALRARDVGRGPELSCDGVESPACGEAE